MAQNKLAEIRKKRNYSQNDLSKITGIDQGQISRYEMYQGLSESSIRKFCEALECNADYLLGLIEEDKEVINSPDFEPISFKQYYINRFSKIPEEEASQIASTYHILNDLVNHDSFLHSNNYSENLYMIRVLTQSMDLDMSFLFYEFDRQWEEYEENGKFPFVIKKSKCSNGLFTYTVSPKIDLYTINLYVKLKVDGQVLLFDACIYNSTKFYANSDYESHFWVVENYDPFNFEVDIFGDCDRVEGEDYEFLNEEEYLKAKGKKNDQTFK